MEQPTTQFIPTPDDGDESGVRIKTVSVSLRRKWNLGDYESLDAEASVWADIEPGISNEKLDGVVRRLHAMVRNSTEAMRLGDASSNPTNKKRSAKTFLGLPLEDAVDELPASDAPLLPSGEEGYPEPEKISLAIAALLSTTNGTPYKELDRTRREQMITTLGVINKSNMPVGWTRSDVIVRRNALYTLNQMEDEIRPS